MTTPAPAGYSRLQISLHWIVAILIVFMIVGHDGIKNAFDAYLDGGVPATADLWLARAHVVSGIAIWIFALWRLMLRFTRGVPPHPEAGSALQHRIAGIVLIALYAVMLLMPVSGSAAWFLGIEQAGDMHSLARFVMLPAILLHILGALVQHFVLKTDSLRRIVKPA